MKISRKHGELINKMKTEFNKFIDLHLIQVVIDIVNDPINGCLSQKYYKFHKIDRFELLCNKIREVIHQQLPHCSSEAKTKITSKNNHSNLYSFITLY